MMFGIKALVGSNGDSSRWARVLDSLRDSFRYRQMAGMRNNVKIRPAAVRWVARNIVHEAHCPILWMSSIAFVSWVCRLSYTF